MKNLVSKNFSKTKVIATTLFTCVIMLSFQNCDNVSIKEMPSVPPVVVVTRVPTKITGSVCASTGADVNYNARTVFVMDMSMSNLGGLTATCTDFSYRGTGWDFVINFQAGADVDGRRFDFAKNIINAGAGSGGQFSIIGFGNTEVLPQGDTCASAFHPSPTAALKVENLRLIQNQDKALPSRFVRSGSCDYTPTSPFNLGSTNFTSAINCLDTKVRTEFLRTAEGESPVYNVVFLTDGKPTLNIRNCDLNCHTQQYIQKIRAIKQSVELENATFNFFPFYYGPTPNPLPDCTNLPPESSDEVKDYCQGIPTLRSIAQGVDPNINVQTSNDFSALQAQVERLLSVDRRITFNLRNISAVNLTALPVKGKLLSDSNINGVADSADTANSDTIRTLFDRFANSLNSGDNIPAFVKKIRGLNPYSNDGFADTDSDGMSNIVELESGRDIFSSEARFPTEAIDLTKIQLSTPAENTCAEGVDQLSFDLSSIGLVDNLAPFQDPAPGVLDFSHGTGENLIFFYFITEPVTGAGGKRFLFGTLVKKRYDSENEIRIDPNSFINLGEM